MLKYNNIIQFSIVKKERKKKMANKKATENILIVSFGTESKTYQAFPDLQQVD